MRVSERDGKRDKKRGEKITIIDGVNDRGGRVKKQKRVRG